MTEQKTSSIGLEYNHLPIRKITIGDVNTGRYYQVGNTIFEDYIIHSITFNDFYWTKYQVLSWDIFITKEGSEDILPWKKHVGNVVTIEWDYKSLDKLA